jgi:hypothetical protein
MTELLPAFTVTGPNTQTINLNFADLISKIQVEAKATSVGTAVSDHPAGLITNMQVVDGSLVLANLSGKEAQSLGYVQNKRLPYSFVTDISGQIASAVADIDFGRWLYDTKYLFDPTKYVNPQLKITTNPQAVDGSATTGTVEARAYFIKAGSASPIGHLMPREFATWAPGASGAVYPFYLPVDKIIRKLVIMARNSGALPNNVCSNIRIDENMDSAIPINLSTSLWNEVYDGQLDRTDENGYLLGSVGARSVWWAACQDITYSGVQTAVTDISACATQPLVNPVPHTDVAAHNITARVSGFRPHGAMAVPFGDYLDDTAWYNPTGVNQLRLQLTAGSGYSGATIQVVLDQVMKY